MHVRAHTCVCVYICVFQTIRHPTHSTSLWKNKNKNKNKNKPTSKTMTNIQCKIPLSYFSFQPVLRDWCNKGCGMCYSCCGMVHKKEPLLLIEKSSPYSGKWVSSLAKWVILYQCLIPYNHNVLSASLNKTFLSFLRMQK